VTTLCMMQKPTDVLIGITRRCNLRCRHCNLWQKTVSLREDAVSFFLAMRDGFAHRSFAKVLRKEELPYKEWIRILSDLKDWLGPYRLSITGGEPFIREDLVDIIRYCHGNGISAAVSTNATLLTQQLISELSGLSTLTLNISLDGSTPKTHDYLRGVSGTYQKVMGVLEQFKSTNRRCAIYIATILMDPNCDEILDIVKLSHERKLADGIIFQALDQAFGIRYKEGWFRKNKFWPRGQACDRLIGVIEKLVTLKNDGARILNSVEQLRKFQSYFTDPARDKSDHCASGKNNFIVNGLGDVFLCWKRSPIAHFSSDPGKLWDSAAAERRRKDIRSCRRTCRLLNCNFKQNNIKD